MTLKLWLQVEAAETSNGRSLKGEKPDIDYFDSSDEEVTRSSLPAQRNIPLSCSGPQEYNRKHSREVV